ncbi:MAG: molybdate ABC transporter permease subunit, partial [Neisseriaceae bacterium]|nr:molybdate ABC transporter permease subunit [Neisseriaceae bacterium]
GEYGSVIFIAGNIPKESEILPLVIASKFEQFDLTGASAVAILMLIISFSVLLFLNWYQRKLGKGLAL